MPTVAAHNNVQTTNAEQILSVRGSTSMEITIGNAGVYLRFAHNIGGMQGGFGLAELHGPKILNISDETIDAVSVKSALAGSPASVTIIATR